MIGEVPNEALVMNPMAMEMQKRSIITEILFMGNVNLFVNSVRL